MSYPVTPFPVTGDRADILWKKVFHKVWKTLWKRKVRDMDKPKSIAGYAIIGFFVRIGKIGSLIGQSCGNLLKKTDPATKTNPKGTTKPPYL